MRRWRLGLLAWAGLLLAAPLWGDPPADCDLAHQRAGYPQSISWMAKPSDTGRYIGYYAGGGCAPPWRAHPGGLLDGTWTWDYQGGIVKRRVVLGYWNGRRYQGGIGAYKTDGPIVLPEPGGHGGSGHGGAEAGH